MEKRLRDAMKKITIDPITTAITVNQYVTGSYFKKYAPAAPIIADVDLYVTSVNMKVGAYTVATPSPSDGLCRNVTATVTTGGGVVDVSLGTLLITGTDYNSKVITETLTLVTGTVTGIKAFKTVTNVVGAGWVIDAAPATEDTITVGCGNKIGMPEVVSKEQIVMTIWNQAMSTTLPTFAYGQEISNCTVTLPAAGDSAKKLIVFYIKHLGT